MKIRLSASEWKQVVISLNANDDCGINASAKPIERVINKINKEITPQKVEISRHPYGMMAAFAIDPRSMFGYVIEFSADDVEIIMSALSASIEAKRDEIDDEVVAIDANDADEPINDIKEHLSDALEKAKEVENLEAIRASIEKQQQAQKDDEKDKKIAELTAKVDTQQMALNSKDGEIRSLRSRNNDADRYIDELRYRLERYEPVRGVRGCDCPMCRPRPSFRGF